VPGRPDEGGQALVVIALATVVVVACAGLAIDLGTVRAAQAAAQAAADAAATAGADDLPGSASAAVADAVAEAQANGYVSGVDGTTVAVNSPPRESRSHNGDPNSVEVIITRQVPTTFLRVLGLGSAQVKAYAVATSSAASGPPCALCVLSPAMPGALDLVGNPSVRITGSGVTVDSQASDGLEANGNATLSSSAIGIVGGYQVTGNVHLTPTPVTGVSPVPDPLASVPPPAVSGPAYGAVTANGNGTTAIDPGIYSTIAVNGNATLQLAPGTYVITNALLLNGNPTIDGSGVTLYFTCPGYSSADPAPCDGQAGAGLTLNGNPVYDLSAPTSGPYQGLTVFYDRGNTAGLTINGNASDDLTGTIYAKSADAVLNGNPGINQLNSLVVVNSATLNGDGQLNISFQQDQNYPVPPHTGSSVLTE
jgi:hypothetical protein